jgi:hypothetical protein
MSTANGTLRRTAGRDSPARASSPALPQRAAPADQYRAAPQRGTANAAAARLGFWSGMLAAGFSLAFSIASVPVLLGAVGPPWDNVLTLVPSLLLAPALLVLMVCVHDRAPDHQQLWSRLGLTFGGLYAALVSTVYVVELTVVEPLIVRGETDRAGLLTIDPGGVLNAIDGLGYIFLCMALLSLAPLFAGTRVQRWIRWFLLTNGAAMLPIALTYFVDRAFLLLAAPLWVIAMPTVTLLLAVWFRRGGQPDTH